MKAIKKVEVTPIDLNIGKIVNSTETTDDKTKNTYSMQVIEDMIAEAEVYDKATYLQKTSAEAIYLSQEDAASTYQPTILHGTTEPSNSLGNDGDIYLQHT